MGIRSVVVLCALRLGCECAYILQSNSTAAFEHIGQPFTQGFEAVVKKSCPNIGLELDRCVAKEVVEESSECIETLLNQCVSLYESSGLYQESFVQVIRNFGTGIPAIRSHIPQDIFAEGLTVLDQGDILLGSWREKRLILLNESADKTRLAYTTEFLIQDPPEIWGLAHSPTTLYLTAGDHYLYSYQLPLKGVPSRGKSRIGPERVSILELKYDTKVEIKCNKRQLPRVNELEYNPFTGTLWGNVWMKHLLYEIDPKTGNCLNVLPLSVDIGFPDRPQSRSRRSGRYADGDKVWNGVTFLSRDWLMLTGKLFDYVYLGKVLPSG